MNKEFTIRLRNDNEVKEVENVIRESFWNVYRPGCFEHYVYSKLRQDKNFIPELDLVMEKDGRLIGQIAFMKAFINADDGTSLPIVTFGPFCVIPEYQKQGYAKILLEYALKKTSEAGFDGICIEGDIDYYGKFGFDFARTFGIRYHGLPENEDSSFFICKELSKGYFKNVTGEYCTPQSYFVTEEEVNEFDKNSPKKEKLKLNGQIFN